MNHLDEQHLQVHVPVVAWLLIVLNSIVLLVALGLFLAMTLIAGLVRDLSVHADSLRMEVTRDAHC